MTSADTNKLKQQEEYELLKSMFDKNVTSDESSEWLDVCIELFPLYDCINNDVYAKIVLRIKCDEHYPDKAPEISLLHGKGLSKMQIAKLHSRLEAVAAESVEEVMIYQLTLCVREFLHENNKPGTESFYDEMKKRQQKLEQQRNRSEEDRITKEFQDIKEKIILKEAKAQFSDDGDDSSTSDDECNKNSIVGSEGRQVRWNFSEVQYKNIGDSHCEHHSCKYLQFKTKHLRGRCLEHDEHSVTYFGIDVCNGQPTIIREYLLKPLEKQTSKELLLAVPVLRQLEDIEKDLRSFINLRNENLMSFLDFKYIVEKDHIIVNLVQEFVSNINLAAYIKCDLTSDVAFIRCVVIGVLRALAFLHQHNILHKNIKNSSIYLSKTGIIKLGDFCLTKRLEELQLSCRQIETGGGHCRSERAVDILQLGAVVLGLLGLPADPANPPVLPDQVPIDLRDFLDKCFLDDDRRWTARQLLEHTFVKTSITREPWKRVRRASECGAGDEVEDDDDEDTNELMSKIPNNLKSQSRLSCEFRVLKYLGSGSFGKVLKAKNKLDDGIYAIKAIELNPRKKNLNKKMIREVKLLSKLNHENVVRYFNSWIETTNVDDSKSVTQVTSTPIQSVSELQSQQALFSKLNGIRAIVEEESSEEEEDDDEDDDDDEEEEEEEEDDEEDDSTSKPNIISEPSESIVFEETKAIEVADSAVEIDDDLDAEETKTLRVLYIQMEFCEKSTLRIAIDEGGLCEDRQRFWRLVREIIEGLAYVHQQDMIHRDLKPVNIFLDSLDHVKIGDFGLATTSVLSRNILITSIVNMSAAESEGSSHLITEDSHTGGVGTSFYVAPELQKISGKAHYNRKVDIYSLGIILFEMTHPPFATNMERCVTLSNLRLPEILAPSTMDEKFPQQMGLVRMVLDHDPAKRPTCQDILSGSWLPPPQVEDSEVQDFIKHTLSNPQSKAYKYLISSCFNQKASIAEDLTYHMDFVGSARHYALQESVRDSVTRILRRHGARCLSTPLFLHISQKSLLGAANYVQLMTHSGSVVLAPRDLRVPLARVIANRCITNIRRYCISRVYKERRTHGFHPRESLECAFDIVTPTSGSLVGDAEMFVVLQEMINELPALKNCNCFLRVNHSLLLEAILISLNVQNMYSVVFQILIDARDSKSSILRLNSRLANAQMNSQASRTLANILRKEDIFNEMTREINALVKRHEEATSKAKRALDQLKTIIRHAELMGCKIPIKVCPGLVNTSEYCSGIMFDLVCPVRQKKKDGYEILATGCRYDELIAQFRKPFELTGSITRDICQSAVGMSVALDKVVSLLKEDGVVVSAINSVVCSLGRDVMMMSSKAEIVCNLRAAGVSSYILENVETIEDVDMYGRDHLISHIIWLKESERGTARVRNWERDRYIEKKVQLAEVVDVILRSMKSSSDSVSAASKPISVDSSVSQNPRISIINNEKIAANTRRAYENQINGKMAQFVSNFSAKPVIEVFGVFLDLKVIMTIATNLDFADDANDFSINTQNILEKYPRHKTYLVKVCDKISSLSAVKKNLVLVLYSLLDDRFKQII